MKKVYERIKNDPEFKEKRRQYAKEYREKNREKINELQKKWHAEHPKYFKEYFKNNKQKVVKKRKPIIICKGPIKVSFD